MAEQNVSNYYDSYYKHLAPDFDFQWFSNFTWSTLGPAFEDAKRDAKVLDIGCGTGQFLQVLKEHGFTNLSGVEIDKAQYAEAIKSIPEATITNADAFDYLEKNKETYDYIALIDVIEHLPKDQVISFMKMVKKHLNPGGTFVIRTPNADSLLMASNYRYTDFTHNFILNSSSMATVLREAGFESFTMLPNNFPHKGIKKIIFGAVQAVGDFLLRVYLFTYIHNSAFKTILTPNFITVVKNTK